MILDHQTGVRLSYGVKIMLTIELVPKTAWNINVRSEVSDSEWNRIKKLTYRKANYICEVCGGKGKKWPVECHEIWNYDDETHIQTLKGLIALCPQCHQVKHIGLAQIKGKYEEAKRHLAKVNGYSNKESEKYIRKQFELWTSRSKYEWTLDCSWLESI